MKNTATLDECDQQIKEYKTNIQNTENSDSTIITELADIINRCAY